MLERLRIINVERKPKNVLYAAYVWWIPFIGACACGCKSFRKVNPDSTDAPVKVKLLKIAGDGYILIPTLRLGMLQTIPSNALSTLDKAYMQSIASRLAAIFLCARMVSSQPMAGRLAPHDFR